MKRFFGIALGILLCATLTHVTHAETDVAGLNPFLTDVTAEDIDIEQTPDFPSAFENVTIRLSSNATDLNRYRISWTVNGAATKSGIGERVLSVKTGAFGEAVVISATIALPAGPVTKVIRLVPEDATILWEAIDSTVPPFYKGKKLPAPEAIVKLTAIPNFRSEGGRSTSSDNAVYIWKRNGSIIEGAGGYGKSSLIIRHDRLRTKETISVKISDLENSNSAETSTILSFFNTQTLFYKKNPDSGIWDIKPSTNFLLRGDSMTVKAVPYYLSRGLADGDKSLTVNWRLNTKELPIPDQNHPLELVLENPGNTGSAQLTFSAENKNYLIQEARSGFTVSFIPE
jgi:hypothetical protein